MGCKPSTGPCSELYSSGKIELEVGRRRRQHRDEFSFSARNGDWGGHIPRLFGDADQGLSIKKLLPQRHHSVPRT